VSTAALTLPAAAQAAAAPSAPTADIGAGSDLFAAVLTALADEQPNQARPDTQAVPDSAPQPPRRDADNTATVATPTASAPIAATSDANELTQSRALLNLSTPTKVTASAPAPAAAAPPATAAAPAPAHVAAPAEQPAPAAPTEDTPSTGATAAADSTPAAQPAVTPVPPRVPGRPQVAPAAEAPADASAAEDAQPVATTSGRPAADGDDSDESNPETAAPTHQTAHHVADPVTPPVPVLQQPVIVPPQTPPPAGRRDASPSEERTSVEKAVTASAEPTSAQMHPDAEPTTIAAAPHQVAPSATVTAPAPAAPASAPARTVPADVAAAVRQQLTGPLVKVTQGDGEQILVVQVRPENLGPVTVHAHVRDNAVHVELFAPSDAGRDALTQVSADLRADLQQAHVGNTSLNVSSQTAPSADRDGKPRDGSPAEPRTGDRHPTGDTTGQDAQQHQPRGSNRLLDVLA
jgi:flagellar hook-length control protein FliK